MKLAGERVATDADLLCWEPINAYCLTKLESLQGIKSTTKRCALSLCQSSRIDTQSIITLFSMAPSAPDSRFPLGQMITVCLTSVSPKLTPKYTSTFIARILRTLYSDETSEDCQTKIEFRARGLRIAKILQKHMGSLEGPTLSCVCQPIRPSRETRERSRPAKALSRCNSLH